MRAPQITRAFLALLRAGLWDKPVDPADSFPLSGQEWVSVFRLAKEQTVEGLVFEGVLRLDAGFLPELRLLTTWLVRVEKIAMRNTWMDGMIQEQLAFFKQAGIEPMLLKGQGLAACYTRPERRSCGDVDWYFQCREAYREANRVIRAKGIPLNPMPGFSTSYRWKECEVEHHSRMLDLHNPFCQAYLQRLLEAERPHCILLPLGAIPLCLPSPLLQSIQVNMHILKHLLSFGIGLRQLCDASRIYFTYQQQLDGVALKTIYKKTGIEQWVYVLHQVLTEFIGLPTSCLPFENPKNIYADWMMADILAAGNFGFHDQRAGTTGKNRGKWKLWRNVRTYLPFAPMEACSFPVVHFYSRFVQ